MVGAERFELSASWSQTRRANRAALRPEWHVFYHCYGLASKKCLLIYSCRRRSLLERKGDKGNVTIQSLLICSRTQIIQFINSN